MITFGPCRSRCRCRMFPPLMNKALPVPLPLPPMAPGCPRVCHCVSSSLPCCHCYCHFLSGPFALRHSFVSFTECMSAYVTAMDLITPNGTLLHLSADSHSQIFEAAKVHLGVRRAATRLCVTGVGFIMMPMVCSLPCCSFVPSSSFHPPCAAQCLGIVTSVTLQLEKGFYVEARPYVAKTAEVWKDFRRSLSGEYNKVKQRCPLPFTQQWHATAVPRNALPCCPSARSGRCRIRNTR